MFFKVLFICSKRGNVIRSLAQSIAGLCRLSHGIPSMISNDSMGNSSNDSTKGRSPTLKRIFSANLHVDVAVPSARRTTCAVAMLTVGMLCSFAYAFDMKLVVEPQSNSTRACAPPKPWFVESTSTSIVNSF